MPTFALQQRSHAHFPFTAAQSIAARFVLLREISRRSPSFHHDTTAPPTGGGRLSEPRHVVPAQPAISSELDSSSLAQHTSALGSWYRLGI